MLSQRGAGFAPRSPQDSVSFTCGRSDVAESGGTQQVQVLYPGSTMEMCSLFEMANAFGALSISPV